MKSTSVNTSSVVTLLDNNVIATINKLRNQHKDADRASIYKELTKYLELNNFTGDHLKRLPPLKKTTTSQNVSPEAQVKRIFYFLKKLCSVFKIFKFLYF